MASKSQKLAQNLAYYIGADKRCKKASNGACYYSGLSVPDKDTEGCFVGRLMTPEMRAKADEHGLGSVDGLIRKHKDYGIKLPKFIIDNEDLMDCFQNIHDNKNYWTDDHFLTQEGKDRLLLVIKEFKLVKKHFKEFL